MSPSRPLLVAIAVSLAWSVPASAQPPPPTEHRAADPNPFLAELSPRPVEPIDAAELAGLAKGSRPPVLTWERVYALALVRARSKGKAAPVLALDPKALADQSERLGVDDFARFRTEFLDPSGGFHDPSSAVFDLLRRLQDVENARRGVAGYERLMTVLREVIQGESSGFSQLQLDQIGVAQQRGRVRLTRALVAYRDALDGFKLELGLSPRAPVAVDADALAAFRDVFEASDRWFLDPKRELMELPRLAQRLPELDDVVIDGRPVLRPSELAQTPDPIPLDDRLTAVVTGSRPGRGADDVRGELRIRRGIRGLAETAQAYEIERRLFVAALLQKNQAQERLIAPPQSATESGGRGDAVLNVLGRQNEILENQGRLVALWTAFQSRRLELYRDLGSLPYSDWASFYAALKARLGKADPGPQPPQTAPPPPPPPGR